MAVEVDPRRVSEVIAGMPAQIVADVARELRHRRERVSMCRFIGHLIR
jgi:hypothetical protein